MRSCQQEAGSIPQLDRLQEAHEQYWEEHINDRRELMFLSDPAIIKVKSFSLEGKLEDL